MAWKKAAVIERMDSPGRSKEEEGSSEGRIQVVCRVRPATQREQQANGSCRCVSVAEDGKTIVLATKPTNKLFTFDHASGEDSTQEEIFECVGKPITQACLEGFNGTVFAYGQTGSGKTFTTFGPSAVLENSMDPSDPAAMSQRGLVPRVLEYLFDSIGSKERAAGGQLTYSCRCSFYEIFNERVFDLLDAGASCGPNGLSVREDTRKGVYVEGLMEEGVDTPQAATEILNQGYRNRHVGETAMNRESSRSHAVFTLVIQAKEEIKEEDLTRTRAARFNLVDLAGSERQKSTNTCGDRLKEASNINGSLSTLGQVISALVEKSQGRERHVGYRNSKLTFLLRDSLGGNSKTMLVAAVSPADMNFAETLSTLKFAKRAKMIKNMAVKNEDTSGSIEALKAELVLLRQQLALAAAAPHSSLPEGGETVLTATATGTVSSLLVQAIQRAKVADVAREGAERRVKLLLEQCEKTEKAALQKEMMLKFRDSALAAQRKKDVASERSAMAEQISFLQRELEGGEKESQEAAKWRLAYREAETQLAQLTGQTQARGKSASPLVWSPQNQAAFCSALDEHVISMTQEVARLQGEAATFAEQLQSARAEASRAMQVTAAQEQQQEHKVIEDALLKKLQESQRAQEALAAALSLSESSLATSDADRTEMIDKVAALAKQLDDEKRRSRLAAEERDAQLQDLQGKIEELIAEKDRVQDSTGNEVANLQKMLATAIKDNGLLLQRARETAAEADEIEDELERARKQAGELSVELSKASVRVEELELQVEDHDKLTQQVEAQERELEERATEKAALDDDFDLIQRELEACRAEKAAIAEAAQALAAELRAELAAEVATCQELRSTAASLRDDYDTLCEGTAYSEGRVEELEAELSCTERMRVELEALLEESKSEILSLRGQASEAQAKLDVQELQRLEAECARAELNMRACEAEERLQDLQGQRVRLEGLLQESEARLGTEVEHAQTQRRELEAQLERQMSQSEAQLEGQRAEFEAKLESQTSHAEAERGYLEAHIQTLDQQLQGQSSQMEVERACLEVQRQKLSEVEAQAEAERVHLEAQLQNLVKELSVKTLEFEAQRSGLEAQLNGLEVQLAAQASESELKRADLEHQLERQALVVEAVQHNASAQRTEFEAQLERRDAEGKAAIADLGSQLESKTTEFEERRAGLEAQLAAQTSEFELQRAALEDQLEKQASVFQAELQRRAAEGEAAREDFAARIAGLEVQTEKQAMEAKSERAALEAQLENRTLEFEAERAGLEARLNSLEVQLQLEKAEFQAELERRTAEGEAARENFAAKIADLEVQAARQAVEAASEHAELEAQLENRASEFEAERAGLEARLTSLEVQRAAQASEFELHRADLEDQLERQASVVEAVQRSAQAEFQAELERRAVEGKVALEDFAAKIAAQQAEAEAARQSAKVERADLESQLLQNQARLVDLQDALRRQQAEQEHEADLGQQREGILRNMIADLESQLAREAQVANAAQLRNDSLLERETEVAERHEAQLLARSLEIAASQERISGLLEKVSHLEAHESQLVQRIESLQTEARELQASQNRTQELQVAIAALEAQVEEQKGEAAAARELAERLEEASARLESQLNEKNSEAEEAGKRASQLGVAISELEARNTEREASFESAISALKAAAEEESAKAKCAHGRAEELEASLSALKAQISLQKVETAAAEGHVQELQTAQLGLESRVGELEGEAAFVSARIHSLTADLELSRGYVKQLETTVAGLRCSENEARAAEVELRRKVDELQEQLGEAIDEASRQAQRLGAALAEKEHNLLRRAEEAEEELEAAKRSIDQLTARVQELHDTNANLAGHTNSRQKIHALMDLKEQINDLTRLNKDLTDEAYRLKKQLGCENERPPPPPKGDGQQRDEEQEQAEEPHKPGRLTRTSSRRARAGGGGLGDITNQQQQQPQRGATTRRTTTTRSTRATTRAAG